MNIEQLQAIKEQAEKATPGPWVYDTSRIGYVNQRPAVIMNFVREHDDWFIHGDISNLDDAKFIASARQDVPALIAEVERLQTAIKQMLDLEVENLEGYDSELHKVGREALGLSVEEYFGEIE